MTPPPRRESALPPKSPDSGKDPMQTETAEAPTPATSRRPSRSAETKQLTVWIKADLHKRMLRLKVEEGTDLREQIEQAVTSYLERHGY
jgi:predicted GNAT superfamily acetyltransferase